MSKHPTHTAIDNDLAGIRDTDLIKLGNRLHARVETELLHPSRPDGHASKVHGAAQATGTHRPSSDCEHCHGAGCDNCGPVDLTDVEQITLARSRHRDEYRDAVRKAVNHLADARRSLAATIAVLDKLDDTRKNADGISDEPGCWALARVGGWEQIAHHVTIDGEVRGLGDWAYRFARRMGRLPTTGECESRATGRRVMVKATR